MRGQKMSAKKEGNAVTYGPSGELALGVPAGMDDAPLRRLTAFFDSIGFAYELPADIRVHQWSKLLCNTGCNQAAMVFQCDYSLLHRPGRARDTMIGAMQEVSAVANAEGVPLSEADVDHWVGRHRRPARRRRALHAPGQQKPPEERGGAVRRHHPPPGKKARHPRSCQRLAL